MVTDVLSFFPEVLLWGPDASIETIPPEGAKRLWTTSSIQVLVQIFYKSLFLLLKKKTFLPNVSQNLGSLSQNFNLTTWNIQLS